MWGSAGAAEVGRARVATGVVAALGGRPSARKILYTAGMFALRLSAFVVSSALCACSSTTTAPPVEGSDGASQEDTTGTTPVVEGCKSSGGKCDCFLRCADGKLYGYTCDGSTCHCTADGVETKTHSQAAACTYNTTTRSSTYQAFFLFCPLPKPCL